MCVNCAPANGELAKMDLAEVLSWHCIYLTNRFTSYNFTNQSHNLQVNHVLHTLNANGINSRPKYYHQVQVFQSHATCMTAAA